MSDRKHEDPVEEPENGVLAESGDIDTTSLFLGGHTAQISVILPGSSDDDDDDFDDDIDDAHLLFDALLNPEIAPVSAAEAAEHIHAASTGEVASVADTDSDPEPSRQLDVATPEVESPRDADQAADEVEAEDDDEEVIVAELEDTDYTLAREAEEAAAAAREAEEAALREAEEAALREAEEAAAREAEEAAAREAEEAAAREAEEAAAREAEEAALREAEEAAAREAEESAEPEPEENDASDAADDAALDDEKDSPVTPEPVTATTAAAKRDLERVKTNQEVKMTSKRLDDLSSASRESSDLLTADRLLDPNQVTKPEPEGAWRHLIYSMSGKRINLGDSKRARARKALTAQIASPLNGGSRFVPVLSRKGGVGKTTVTALLGMALADARDDRVIAVDANPDRGTLAERIARPTQKTVRDLVRARDDIRGFNDISDIVARDETRLDVLASETDPRVSEAFSDEDYRHVADVAARYYSLVLTDTGTGIVHSVMGATLDLADQLIIVAGLSVDEARLASETLTWLETNGYEQQVRDAIVVLNQGSPGAPLVRMNEVEGHFRTRVKEVVKIPYDPMIATGSAIHFHDLQPETRQAARALAAKVVESLRQHS